MLAIADTMRADIIQSDDSIQGTYVGPYPHVIQDLGKGLKGTFGNIQLNAKAAPGSTGDIYVQLIEYTPDTSSPFPFANYNGIDTYTAWVGNDFAFLNFTNGSNKVADPTKYYALNIGSNSAFTDAFFWGSSNLNSYNSSGAYFTCNAFPPYRYPTYDYFVTQTTEPPYIRQLYFSISGVSVPEPSTLVLLILGGLVLIARIIYRWNFK